MGSCPCGAPTPTVPQGTPLSVEQRRVVHHSVKHVPCLRPQDEAPRPGVAGGGGRDDEAAAWRTVLSWPASRDTTWPPMASASVATQTDASADSVPGGGQPRAHAGGKGTGPFHPHGDATMDIQVLLSL